MSGVVAVGSLVAVIELGAPIANNLGLGLGTVPAGHGATVSQALNNPAVPSWGLAATSVANAPSSGPVAGTPTIPSPTSGPVTGVVVPSVAPSSAVAPPSVAATNNVSSHVVAAPTGTVTVSSTNNGNDAAAHASALVDPATSDQAVQSQEAQQGGHGQNGQHGQGNSGQGNGGQGNGGQGNGGQNAPQGRALGHSH
jgi:hypothetical protein